MPLKKHEFTTIISDWLSNYLENKYEDEYNIDVIIPKSHLSRISKKELKQYKNYSALEFKPDVLGILSNKNDIRLVFLNRSIQALSLKEIGEMHCYSKLAKPQESFITSTKGVSDEVQLILFNEKMEKSLLEYDQNKSIIIFRWLVDEEKIDPHSIFPFPL